MIPETQKDKQVADPSRGWRYIARRMTLIAAALIALGVLIMFLPGSHGMHLIAGIAAIACGLIVLGLTADMRRRAKAATKTGSPSASASDSEA